MTRPARRDYGIPAPRELLPRGKGGGQASERVWSCTLVLLLAATAVNSYAVGDCARYVSQEIPDKMVAGTTEIFKITMENTCPEAWERDAYFKLGSNPAVWGPWRIELPEGVSIPLDGIHTFERPIKAPSAPGVYTSQWQMFQGGSQMGMEWFGDLTPPVDVLVVPPMDNFITVEDGRFMDGETEFRVAGFTYIPYFTDEQIDDWQRFGPYADGKASHQQRAWFTYDLIRDTVEEELEEMARLGATVIRIYSPNLLQTSANPPQYDLSYCDYLDHMLTTAQENGLRVILSLVGGPGRPHRNLLYEEFCPDGCPNNDPGSKWNVIADEQFRDFHIQLSVNLIEQCGLADRKEIMAYSIYAERNTKTYSDGRALHGAVAAWDEWVKGKYGNIQEARDTWDYQLIQENCGANGDQICPPDDEEFCGIRMPEQVLWTDAEKVAQDYRRFANSVLDAAYKAVFDALIGSPGSPGVAPNQLLTSGLILPVQPAQKNPKPDEVFVAKECAQRGYRFNPRTERKWLDFVSIHPSDSWLSDMSPNGDQDLPDSLQDDSESDDRLRFVTDYVRTGNGGLVLPVVWEETGRFACASPRWLDPDHPCQDATELAERDAVHRDVIRWIAEVANAIDAHVLFLRYRGTTEGGDRDGFYRYDKTPRPIIVEGLADDVLAQVREGYRSTDNMQIIGVDLYLDSTFLNGLYAGFLDYQAAEQLGPVRVTTTGN